MKFSIVSHCNYNSSMQFNSIQYLKLNEEREARKYCIRILLSFHKEEKEGESAEPSRSGTVVVRVQPVRDTTD